MTMELDLTQKKSDNGVLKFIMHHKPKRNVNLIKSDGIYSNIAFDDIDIDKEYRAAFDIGGKDVSVQLLPNPPPL